MDILGALPEAIKLVFRDELWLKNIYYEHIPFQCQKFHENGNLFRDYPRTNHNKTTLKHKRSQMPNKDIPRLDQKLGTT